MISGIATLSAHMLPASSTDEATALCDESRHSSEASFVTIAIAAHFMTGAMNSSPELVMLFISSASSRRGAVKLTAAKHIETAAAEHRRKLRIALFYDKAYQPRRYPDR